MISSDAAPASAARVPRAAAPSRLPGHGGGSSRGGGRRVTCLVSGSLVPVGTNGPRPRRESGAGCPGGGHTCVPCDAGRGRDSIQSELRNRGMLAAGAGARRAISSAMRGVKRASPRRGAAACACPPGAPPLGGASPASTSGMRAWYALPMRGSCLGGETGASQWRGRWQQQAQTGGCAAGNRRTVHTSAAASPSVSPWRPRSAVPRPRTWLLPVPHGGGHGRRLEAHPTRLAWGGPGSARGGLQAGAETRPRHGCRPARRPGPQAGALKSRQRTGARRVRRGGAVSRALSAAPNQAAPVLGMCRRARRNGPAHHPGRHVAGHQAPWSGNMRDSRPRRRGIGSCRASRL